MNTTAFLASVLIALHSPLPDAADSAAALEQQPLGPVMAMPVTPPAERTLQEPVDEFRGLAEPRVWDLDDWDAAEGARGGGGVAILFGLYNPPRGQVNDIARQLGFPGSDGRAFGGAPLRLQGMRAFGHVGRNFRVGGMYATGGQVLASDVDDFRRRLSFEVDQVGLTLEFVYPQRRWELYGGGLLGSSTYRFHYSQRDRVRKNARLSWDETLDELSTPGATETFGKRFSNSFLVANPWVGGKVKLSPWFSIDANVGWLFGRASDTQWGFTDSDWNLAGAPSVDASGFTARLEATFGFFPF